MSAGVVIPQRPTLRERDVELATALGASPTVRVWRERLATVRAVRARRCVRGRIVGREAWWDVRLEADDGWHAEGEIVDVESLIDIDGITADLPARAYDAVPGGRVRRLVRWLLWDEIWVARDRLASRLMDANLTEFP